MTPGDIEESVSAELIVTSNDTSDGEIIVRFGARFFVPFGNEGTLWFVGVDDDGQDGDGNASLNDPAFFNGSRFFRLGGPRIRGGHLARKPCQYWRSWYYTGMSMMITTLQAVTTQSLTAVITLLSATWTPMRATSIGP